MALKIPSITQQPVGEFALGNIRQPDYAALGRAQADVVAAAGSAAAELLFDEDTQVSESTAGAAKDLSELRANLEVSNTVATEEIPDGIVAPVSATVLDLKGDRVEIGQPRTFTHTVADEWWKLKSEEIVQYWAGKIANKEDRAEFLEAVGTRYVAPGTFAIAKSTILRRRAYGQAVAENTIRDIAAATGPKGPREEQALAVINRQAELGADPVWVEDQKEALGPLMDQLEIQNEVFAAANKDQIDLIEEEMFSSETRMTPAQIRTMSSLMDSRRAEFDAQEKERQEANAEKAFYDFVNPDTPFNEMDVADLVNGKDITDAAGWTLYNALQRGSTTRASDPIALSLYRGAITSMPYTGNQARVKDRANLLRLTIAMAAAGLNPNGTPSGVPATLTGEDAFKLMKDVSTAETAALENDDYDRALKQVYTWTHVAVDLECQISVALGGNQHQIDAALAFKRGLDNYMDSFGADAKPSEYFTGNKDAFNPNNFADGINARFLAQVPQATPFIIIDTAADTYRFDGPAQEEFVLWLADSRATMDEVQWNAIDVLFKQYYRGQGLAPQGGRLDLEPDNPMYRQFEALIE